MAIHGLQIGVILTTYFHWDDPPSIDKTLMNIWANHSLQSLRPHPFSGGLRRLRSIYPPNKYLHLRFMITNKYHPEGEKQLHLKNT